MSTSYRFDEDLQKWVVSIPKSDVWWCREYEWKWLFCRWLYDFTGSEREDGVLTVPESPLPDIMFDNMEECLERWRKLWSPEFKARLDTPFAALKSQGFIAGATLSDAEKQAAIAWCKAYKEDPTVSTQDFINKKPATKSKPKDLSRFFDE